MAKKTDTTEEVKILLPAMCEVEEEEFISIEEVKDQEYKSVTPKRDFKCRIGESWYTFKKDKPQKVSPFVESILRKDKTKLYL